MLKIQYKAAFIMTALGVATFILLSLGYDQLSHRAAIKKELKNLEDIAAEVVLHVESHIKEKATIAATIASAPVIREALINSNNNFASMTSGSRKYEIESRDRRWRETKDINSPFIQVHMINPVAEFLKHQQAINPGEYGEIFLTNRYGVMIATTGKLSTLAHAHKYWWQASYDGGHGRIFLDDRGFDNSVQGYVLGVVVPIFDKEEIIGILKCNVNIMGPLTDVIVDYGKRNPGKMQVVRTGGLVVSAEGVVPLSISVAENLLALLAGKESGAKIIEANKGAELVAYSPVQITTGSEKYGFGGSQESIDHIKGNEGEAWHVVVSRGKEVALSGAHETTVLILIVGIIFTMVTALVALFLGRWASRPIVELANTAQTIGRGNLGVRAAVSSNDEIGFLAASLNAMTENLQETMTSRDELVSEVDRRKKEEEKKEKLIVELQDALHEVKTLRGIIPICAFCKKIRDDKGYWNQVEVYVKEHSEANFSHSFCPDCAKKHYPEFVYDEEHKG